jgi:hypothetical protein
VRRRFDGPALAAASVLLACQGCSVGKGWSVVQGCIHLPGCDLDPDGGRGLPWETCTEQDYDVRLDIDFFAAEVLDDGSLVIRVQDGGYRRGESDGLMLTVPDRAWAAQHTVDEPGGGRLAVVPLDELDAVEPERRFQVSAFVYGSCPYTEASFAEGVGEIWFYSMLQDPDLGDERSETTIHFGFELDFVDPRPYAEPQPDSPRLHLVGEVRFNYQRGSPAQPFP